MMVKTKQCMGRGCEHLKWYLAIKRCLGTSQQPHALHLFFYFSYVQSALKIFKAAEESRLDRDEEKAYILYMKYVAVYNFIKKRPDFKQQQVQKPSV